MKDSGVWSKAIIASFFLPVGCEEAPDSEDDMNEEELAEFLENRKVSLIIVYGGIVPICRSNIYGARKMYNMQICHTCFLGLRF